MAYNQVSYVFEINRGLKSFYKALGKSLIRNINQGGMVPSLDEIRIISCTPFQSILYLRYRKEPTLRTSLYNFTSYLKDLHWHPQPHNILSTSNSKSAVKQTSNFKRSKLQLRKLHVSSVILCTLTSVSCTQMTQLSYSRDPNNLENANTASWMLVNFISFLNVKIRAPVLELRELIRVQLTWRWHLQQY